ncbi:OmpA family protein [Dyadobacter aurulentus]|uniref:OmpA family protein n=1 Tax=Dyadobacter sp. UC 10 TaxID=2605428 RepID=UPI0011F182C5|nr:OmpA family protein [Dyadobacter sp. UC 10]KAA0991951.1 OmpA family protein [Dyadobacter sp. UC 10]
MKNFLLVIIFSAISICCPAQLLDRIKNRVEQKVVDQVDRSIDKALEKKEKESATKPDSSVENRQNEEPANNAESDAVPNAGDKNAAAGDITSYSRFDFIPGEKIIAHEDFSKDEVGDFPANWNTRSGAELVTVEGRAGKWLRMNQNGIFYPENLTADLPENFTLQLDLLANKQVSNIGELMISLMQTSNADQVFEWGESDRMQAPSFKISFQPTGSDKGQLIYSSNLIGRQSKYGVPEFRTEKNSTRVSIWRQKQRVRVYLDSTKILDLPRALDGAAPLNTLAFAAINPDFNQKGGAFFISNIVLAVGAADTRNKLVTEGRFTTHGILFDVNSDKILPQSYGTLKEITRVLQENASMKVQIVGHTDADGDDASNIDLSKRRAAAVKEAMIIHFNIDGARLETDGKGETQPVDTNETQVGKAGNRRVEFIKM